MNLLKRIQVEQMLSLGRQSLYHLMKNNGFPQPVRLSAKRVAWVKGEVEEWVAAQPRGTHAKSRFFPFNRGALDPAVPATEPAPTPDLVPLAVAVPAPRARKKPAAKKRATARKPRKAP